MLLNKDELLYSCGHPHWCNIKSVVITQMVIKSHYSGDLVFYKRIVSVMISLHFSQTI